MNMNAVLKEIKRRLQAKSLDELVELSYNQGLEIDQIRGYKNGMQRFMYRELGKDVLIDCYVDNIRKFKVFGDKEVTI